MLKNRCLTVKDLTDMIGTSEKSVKTILKNHLGLRKVKSRLVPKTLNFLEKKVVALMCVKQCFLTIRTSSNASLREMRLGFMLTTLIQTNQANIVLKARPDRKEHVKVVQKSRSWWQYFFDFRDVVHYGFLPPWQTVNKEYYLSVMRRSHEAIRLKRSELWANSSCCLCHDNAPSHTALVLRDDYVKNSTHIVPQSPYSPDLALCDFRLFPKLQRPLRGTRFESIDEIKAELKKALMAIPKKDYLACFED